MGNESYYSLHNHTDYSSLRLIDSINKVTDLIDRAFELQLKGVAITDHECISSYVEALDYVEKQRKSKQKKNETEEQFNERIARWKDFKLILGNEIYLCRNGMTLENFRKGDYFPHFILLAVDRTGNDQIRQLSTRAFHYSFIRNNMVRVPTYYRDLEEVIMPNRGHVIASSACLGSWLDKSLLEYDRTKNERLWKEIHSWIEHIQNIFGKKNFFLELQPSEQEEQHIANKWLLKLSDELSIPAIITTDSHYLKLEDRELHKAFLNSKDGDREVMDFYASAYMMGAEEIHGFMDATISREKVSECLRNTSLIGDRVEEYGLENDLVIPYLPSAEDRKWLEECDYTAFARKGLCFDPIWNFFKTSRYPSDRMMIEKLIRKMNENPEHYYTQYRIDRLNIELKNLWDSSEKQNCRWSAYSLQVADYVDLCWNEGDSLVCPGRGSAVSYYLNYLLSLTQVDPCAEKAPMRYWRYLNPERASVLDVDTDVQSNRRDKIIEALENRYGKDRVVRVATFKTEGSKSALLTAARGLGYSPEEGQYWASMIVADRGQQRTLKQTYYGDVDNDFAPNKLFQREMDAHPEVWETAQKIEGLVTGVS